MTVSRRTALMSTAAAAVAAVPMSAGSTPAEQIGPNDRELRRLHAEWRRLQDRRDRLEAEQQAIEQTTPERIANDTQRCLSVVFDSDAPPLDREAARDRLYRLNAERREVLSKDGRHQRLLAIEAEDNSLCKAQAEIEDRMGEIEADTLAGARAQVDVLDQNLETCSGALAAETVLPCNQTLVFRVMDVVRRFGGRA